MKTDLSFVCVRVCVCFQLHRYSNEGVRIDFILVDGAMYGESVRREDYCLHGGCERVAEGSEEAALRMATAFGNFQPVPFTGGGMADPPMKAYVAPIPLTLSLSPSLSPSLRL